ncbi:MAG: exodeoxyribonuclease VII large subunit [Planctomycetota bacterium]
MTPDEPFTVSTLTNELRGVLGATFDDVVVRGEVSQARRVASGHVYLTLKDAGAVLPAVIWRSAAARLRVAPEDGLEVLARGGIDVYPPHGRYQLIVRQLEAVGAGALQRAFEMLRARLEAEGLFAPERKKPLPVLPRTVALVTSRTGAAVRDLVRVLHQRHPGLRLVLVPTRVQGGGAAQEIALALHMADTLANADVIVLARGGGSLEDLWCFNEEVVARAIAACNVPVVSAVGHETDVTIADLVADVRAATPSHAGELVAPMREDLLRALDREGQRLGRRLRARVDAAWQRVEALGERPVLKSPRALLARWRARLGQDAVRLRAAAPAHRLARWRQQSEDLSRRLGAAAPRAVATRRGRLDVLGGRLRALSPLAVMARGWSLVTDESGRLVRTTEGIVPGARLVTRFGDGGHVESRVDVVRPPTGEQAS